jgi:16S rRNA processing protein RimM
MAAKQIWVATIGAPHGTNGAVRLNSRTEDPLAVANFGPLFDGSGRRFVVVSVRRANSSLVARFAGVESRETAQMLTGRKLFAPRSSFPPLEEDELYYLVDLVGLSVLDRQGGRLGSIVLADDYGAGGVIEIEFDGGRREMFAFTKASFPDIDIESGTVTFIAPGTVNDRDAEEDAP